MDVRLLRKPLGELFSLRKQCLFHANVPVRRHESSYRRTKKKLNIKPESSFLFSKESPQQDHIIFNPPSAAPSVLHTPLKFLPKDDPRRHLFAASTTSTLATSTQCKAGEVSPRKPGYQRHHLSEEDVAEMRRLRAMSPKNWSWHKLSKKYNCSAIFVSICLKEVDAKLELQSQKLEAVKAKWGPKRTMAREDRQKRKAAVFRDE